MAFVLPGPARPNFTWPVRVGLEAARRYCFFSVCPGAIGADDAIRFGACVPNSGLCPGPSHQATVVLVALLPCWTTLLQMERAVDQSQATPGSPATRFEGNHRESPLPSAFDVSEDAGVPKPVDAVLGSPKWKSKAAGFGQSRTIFGVGICCNVVSKSRSNCLLHAALSLCFATWLCHFD